MSFHVISGSLSSTSLVERNTTTDTGQAVPRTGYFHRDECKCAEAQMGISLDQFGADGAKVF